MVNGARMRQEEHNEQVNLMKWWSLAHFKFKIPERCLFAIPNGGQRNVITAKRLKDEGVRSGIPDLFLAVTTPSFSGLFIEMKKAKGGRVSKHQEEMLKELSERGYKTEVCHGWSEAVAAIQNYLGENHNA